MVNSAINIAADSVDSWLGEHANTALPGGGVPWLQAQRSAALAQFEQVGLPGVRDEQWRYTNLRALKSKLYTLNTANPGQDVSLPDSEANRLVFVDGHYRADLSSPGTVAEGIIVGSLGMLLDQQAEVLEPWFGGCLPAEPHGFTALNTAYCQDGFVLVLPSNAVLEEVLEVLFVSSSAQDSTNRISHSRNLVVAGANSQCRIVERHIGADGAVYLNNSVTEIHAADNAHVDHYKLQQEAEEAFHMGAVFIKQGGHATVKSHNIALSGLVTRNDINCYLLGQGGHVEMNGLVIGHGRRHVDNHTEVNHAVPHCTSDEYYKSILDDHSRSVFRGRIIVAQDAQQTNADQQNNNLLLSKDAEADTKPQLEIYADDVKCSHGATVGQLDPKSMFYLRSRGIDAASAKALLTFAFANEVIERIQLESIRQELTHIIAGHLLSGLEELL
ncbi:MAG: Fe-S cluster assembly protein SufD [Pseudomonadota bacterium]